MEKNLRYGALLSVYKALLTEKQALAMEYYYDEDLSLGEIAENVGISRQGARDFIKRAEEQLDFYEENTRLLETVKALYDIDGAAEIIETASSERGAITKAREIREIVKKLLSDRPSSAPLRRETEE